MHECTLTCRGPMDRQNAVEIRAIRKCVGSGRKALRLNKGRAFRQRVMTAETGIRNARVVVLPINVPFPRIGRRNEVWDGNRSHVAGTRGAGRL
jgi:hypothetical protein